MLTRCIICRGHAKAIGEAVEAWGKGEDAAMEVRDLEDVLPACLALRDELRGLHKEAFDLLLSDRLRDTQAVGRLIQEAYVHALQAFRGVAEGVRWAGQKGYGVGRAPEFDEAARDVRGLSDDFSRRWPLFDPKGTQEGMGQAARGELASDEDVSREREG
jgi:hypothetical protein